MRECQRRKALSCTVLGDETTVTWLSNLWLTDPITWPSYWPSYLVPYLVLQWQQRCRGLKRLGEIGARSCNFWQRAVSFRIGEISVHNFNFVHKLPFKWDFTVTEPSYCVFWRKFSEFGVGVDAPLPPHCWGAAPVVVKMILIVIKRLC